MLKITDDIENLGALKNGKSSVYIVRQLDDTIRAVKIFPTPVKNSRDPYYLDFQQAVSRLKELNEEPRANIAKITGTGITSSGSFPFLEMEFIEGPDLEEMTRPPHDPVFTIDETIRVAEDITRILAICHNLDIRHGAIKSSSIKYSEQREKYILLDFGFTVLTIDEQRSDLQTARALPYMAPEQEEGQLLSQTDVYRLGVVLFRLLTNKVPFPADARRVGARPGQAGAHVPFPDLSGLRKAALPAHWTGEKKDQEARLPAWLVRMIQKCLEKDPEERFYNGVELLTYLLANHKVPIRRKSRYRSMPQQEIPLLPEEHPEPPVRPVLKASTLPPVSDVQAPKRARSFYPLLFLGIITVSALAGYAIFQFQQNKGNTPAVTAPPSDTLQDVSERENPVIENQVPAPQQEDRPAKGDTVVRKRELPPRDTAVAVRRQPAQRITESRPVVPDTQQTASATPNAGLGSYKVLSRAYFHNRPDESTRRNAFITHWNKSILQPQREENDFFYIVYVNHQGQTSRGWLRKKDLVRIEP